MIEIGRMSGECPKCNEIISELIESIVGIETCSLTNYHGSGMLDDCKFKGYSKTKKYACPRCKKVVAKTSEEALNILGKYQ